MILHVRQSCPCIKISVEVEKPQPILKELISVGDVVFISKDFSKFAGYQSMEKAALEFMNIARPG